MLSSDLTLQLVRRQAFVLLLTAASNASHWVGQELDTYIAYARDSRTRLVDGVERLDRPRRAGGQSAVDRARHSDESRCRVELGQNLWAESD